MKAVDGLNVEVKAGQTLGIVGESGSGKSVTSLSVMQLLPRQTARLEEGSKIVFAGENLVDATEQRIRSIQAPTSPDLPRADDVSKPCIHHR